MAEEESLKEFPDVNHKLAAPKKLSAFEKERQAAQAKERRAEAENAAALKAFEDSFAYDNNDSDDALSGRARDRGPPPGPRGSEMGIGGSAGRYGGPPGPRSGPGSLGPPPGLPPPSLKRKRALDEMREMQEARREHDMVGLDDVRSDTRAAPQAITQEDEQELHAPRPTIQLSSLPPSTSEEDIEALLQDHLNVHSVRLFDPERPAGNNGKLAASALATLAADVSTSQIDTAVSTLKERYLGCGFYLSISRHLSSAAVHPTISATTIASSSSEPFGAEKPRDQHLRFSMRNAPPPLEHRGFAPPDSYDSSAPPSNRNRDRNRNEPDAIVAVHPPPSLAAIRAVHIIIERLRKAPTAKRAVQIEAALMSLPEVQQDERFAFLYDSRSPAGVYYRYLLWQPTDEEKDDSEREKERRTKTVERVFDNVAIEWQVPALQEMLPFADLCRMDHVVTHMDYVSSDEDSDDEDDEKKIYSGKEGEGPVEGGAGEKKKHLTPLKYARLVHLLSRMPTSNAKLRKGDVARVTNFAITHAGSGAEEVVDLLLLNVEKPLSYSLASKYEDFEQPQDESDAYEPDEDLSNLDSPAPPPTKDSKRDDEPSNAKLIALYIISDILSASSTAGARNAWKYRQLFESGFKYNKTFEHLGKLEKQASWGRLKAEQWKRKIGVVFGIWETWSVFSGDVLEELKGNFFEPALSEEEKAAAALAEEAERKKGEEEKWMGKFKRVEQTESPALVPAAVGASERDEDLDGPRLSDLDGKPMDEDLDGKPMDDEVDGMPMDGIDGVPMDDEDVDGAPMAGLDGATDEKAVPEKSEAKVGMSISSVKTAVASGKPSAPRRRMRAEDMFADSDEE